MRFMPCRLGKDGDLVKMVKYLQDDFKITVDADENSCYDDPHYF